MMAGERCLACGNEMCELCAGDQARLAHLEAIEAAIVDADRRAARYPGGVRMACSDGDLRYCVNKIFDLIRKGIKDNG